MSDTLQYSESITAFAPAYVALQAAMPNLEKSATSHHGKYANLGHTIETIKPILADHGFAIAQPASGGTGGHVTVTTILLHTSGEWMRDTLSMPTGGNGAQGIGSALSYARRYALNAMLSLAAEDDDGQAASTAPAARKQATPRKQAEPRADAAPAMPSANATKKVMAMFAEAGIKERSDRLAFTSWAVGRAVGSWSEVNAVESVSVIDALADLLAGKLQVVVEGDGLLTVRPAA